jgi:hypothetical protein
LIPLRFSTVPRADIRQQWRIPAGQEACVARCDAARQSRGTIACRRHRTASVCPARRHAGIGCPHSWPCRLTATGPCTASYAWLTGKHLSADRPVAAAPARARSMSTPSPPSYLHPVSSPAVAAASPAPRVVAAARGPAAPSPLPAVADHEPVHAAVTPERAPRFMCGVLCCGLSCL